MHLRLFEGTRNGRPTTDAAPRMEMLNRAFALATGWQLDDAAAARANASGDQPTGRGPREPDASRLPLEQAASLAEALAGLADDLDQTQQALRQREAELAAAVPVVRPRHADAELADRLEAILHVGAETIGCVAAGLYLLDDATTSLGLRACWNLPDERFVGDARPLATALGDLEALCGHAVSVEDSSIDASWNPPELFPAFICVPVSSSRVPLGTLWFFAPATRTFSDHDVGVVEALAGRLAVELERESVLAQCAAEARLLRQLDQAQQIQQNQLPRVAPLVENWHVNGRKLPADSLNGSFHDWMTTADDRLLVCAAQAQQSGLAGALVAANLRTAWRAHGQYHPSPARLLERVSHALWTGSAGDQCASIASALIDPASGRLLLGTAGTCLAVLVGEHGFESLVELSLPMGRQPTAEYRVVEREMAPGDLLLLASGTNLDLASPSAAASGLEALGQILDENRDRDGAALLEAIQELFLAIRAGKDVELSILIAQHQKRRRAKSRKR